MRLADFTASKEVPMIVRFARTLDPFTFAEKYPKAHIVVGHFDPSFATDEEATGEPTLLTVLMTAQNTLGLIGECTGTVDTSSSTMRLSYALAEDAARVCRLVNATPVKSNADCLWMASFRFDARLYNELLGVRNKRIAAIRAAYERGERVEHVVGPGEPMHDNLQALTPMNDDEKPAGTRTTPKLTATQGRMIDER
jgi:hypothetical protein